MSRIPPLPQPAAWMTQHDDGVMLWPTEAEAIPYSDEDEPAQPLFTADQLRARDRQIVEACIAEAERQRGALTAGGAYANGMRSAYEHMAHRLRSLLGEGEGNMNGG